RRYESVLASNETDSPVPAPTPVYAARGNAAGRVPMRLAAEAYRAWRVPLHRKCPGQRPLAETRGSLPPERSVAHTRLPSAPAFAARFAPSGLLVMTYHQGRDRPQRSITAPHDKPIVTLVLLLVRRRAGVSYPRTRGGSPTARTDPSPGPACQRHGV